MVLGLKKSLSHLGQLSLYGPYIHSAGPIRHLKTSAKLKLKKDISFQKLCALLHPTPALGGFPKKLAWDLLLKWEKAEDFSRFGFGAPFGAVFKK